MLMEKVKQDGRKGLLEIRKYQNRRYYDTTSSAHISLEQIHRKICEGYDIRVVDAKTGEDITTKVLTQILLEYEPMKLEFFSSDVLTQVIRVNDSILKDFYDKYFGEAFALFTQSRSQFETLMKQSPFFSGVKNGFPMSAFGSGVDSFAPFSRMFGGSAEKGESRDIADELESLKKQVEDLKHSINNK